MSSTRQHLRFVRLSCRELADLRDDQLTEILSHSLASWMEKSFRTILDRAHEIDPPTP